MKFDLAQTDTFHFSVGPRGSTVSACAFRVRGAPRRPLAPSWLHPDRSAGAHRVICGHGVDASPKQVAVSRNGDSKVTGAARVDFNLRARSKTRQESRGIFVPFHNYRPEQLARGQRRTITNEWQILNVCSSVAPHRRGRALVAGRRRAARQKQQQRRNHNARPSSGHWLTSPSAHAIYFGGDFGGKFAMRLKLCGSVSGSSPDAAQMRDTASLRACQGVRPA
jgi:hypothetical protein